MQVKRSADSHDVTCFGATAHAFAGGLENGTITLSGTYDDTSGGPRATIEPLLATSVTFVYKPEGTGSGKPQDSVSVVVTAYEETAAAADMVKWAATLQLTGAVTTTDQE